MENTTAARSSFFGLFRALTGDTKRLIRQEIQLAKTEISEKISSMGHNAVSLAIGGFVAYAGLIVLLIGLGCLLAWVFADAGLSPIFSGFLGLGAIGLVVAVIGLILVLKAVKSFSKESLAPKRTIHTLQELRGAPTQPEFATEENQQQPSSEQIQAKVEATEDRMGETLDELGHRLSPQHINAQVKTKIQANPYRAGLIAMGAGLVSGLLLRRKFRHA